MDIAVLIIAIIIGLFVLAPSFLKGNEDAQKALNEARTYQGIIGVVVGIFAVIAFIVIYLGHGHFWVTLYNVGLLGATLTLIVLGFLLGYQLIFDQVLSKNEKAKEQAEAFRAKWDPRQSMLGWIAFALGVVALISKAILS